ncbi:phage holin family protein [Streptomyces sp. SCA3-4]|uniref:phage holin family protein n=1 Tax=Streptomyces sichuanensis TaxID=2871810 RepID=UPI001CE383F1|nr:phage holin family protein [Streptomyces sichuanensis]MCA6096099.1 phage holin family protein [Streptomyces sichuanensis]
MTDQPPEGRFRASPDGGLAGAAERLYQDVGFLVRAELERARPGIATSLRRAGLGTGALVAAGACGILALLSAHEAALRTLERSLPPRCAAATLTGAYAVSATCLAWFGYRRLQDAQAATQQALDEVRGTPA